MSKFKPHDKGQIMLLPPSVEDFVPEGHLARVIDQVVETLNVRQIELKYSDLGQKSYSPKLLLKLLFYGYCTGVRSGRKIAMRCETDTAFMYLTNMYRPDFRTINDFRKDNLEAFESCFKQVLLMCKRLGMIKAGLLAIDSTKLGADASMQAFKTKEEYQEWEQQIGAQIKEVIHEAEQNDSKEDREHGDKRGDELPAGLQSLKALKYRIQQVSKQMEEKGRVNFTDTDAKVIKSGKGFGANYNCQTAVDQNGIILAAYASNSASDKQHLTKVLKESESNTGLDFGEVVADAGYSSYDNYETMEKMGKTVYIPDQEHRQKKHTHPYNKVHFIYNPKADTYTCPEGKTLTFSNFHNNKRDKQRSRLYKGIQCHTCLERTICTKG